MKNKQDLISFILSIGKDPNINDFIVKTNNNTFTIEELCKNKTLISNLNKKTYLKLYVFYTKIRLMKYLVNLAIKLNIFDKVKDNINKK